MDLTQRIDDSRKTGILDVSHMNLTSLPELPDNLTQLDCSNNRLTSLPRLPPNLRELDVFMNQLTSLPPLPTHLVALACNSNRLTQLPPLPPTLEALYCLNNELTSLPNLPESLDVLWCSDNRLTELPTLPTKIDSLVVHNNPFKPAVQSILDQYYEDLPQFITSINHYVEKEKIKRDAKQLMALKLSKIGNKAPTNISRKIEKHLGFNIARPAGNNAGPGIDKKLFNLRGNYYGPKKSRRRNKKRVL